MPAAAAGVRTLIGGVNFWPFLAFSKKPISTLATPSARVLGEKITPALLLLPQNYYDYN